MSLFGKIDFNQLSDVDRTIYQYFADHTEKIGYMRIREIANESHTSASSVMRFIRKMGFSSFVEFKANFKNEPRTELEFFQTGQQLLAAENFPNNLSQHLQEVAQFIYEAENVVFFGMGASGSLCDYAARKMATIGYNSFALTDPTYPIAQKLRNTVNNVIIVLSVTGTTTELLETINGFKNRDDYTTVAICANENSLLAQLADHTLSYHVDIRHADRFNDLTSQIPALFLVESLVAEVEKLNN
ncbi:MurR/RpiR family transcriptional regulator [Enterococcus timonensis]|uniref:MurR/RpiR family transcriptional regulator n=1 Tax=Enterococcus timonensis TaxID=1852364 RepID=UPI0008DB0F95|nr:MurR/RpiR family transcriptional regulator [Enterococcus timonensis]